MCQSRINDFFKWFKKVGIVLMCNNNLKLWKNEENYF